MKHSKALIKMNDFNDIRKKVVYTIFFIYAIPQTKTTTIRKKNT
jgi:hypothetical protein